MIKIDDLENKFNRNISNIINTKIDDINNFRHILPDILNQKNIVIGKSSYKLTDEILLYEIYSYFGENCISERTFKSIKAGGVCSSALNICFVVHTINSIIFRINSKLLEYKSSYEQITKIDLNELFKINDLS